MASQRRDPDEVDERCENCERETPHSVTVELRTESTSAANASFSREPYRVSECRDCGEAVVQRMSDA